VSDLAHLPGRGREVEPPKTAMRPRSGAATGSARPPSSQRPHTDHRAKKMIKAIPTMTQKRTLWVFAWSSASE
jgi:hypothetical protein